jgi:hypothetical protein
MFKYKAVNKFKYLMNVNFNNFEGGKKSDEKFS